jgi:cytochrome P450
MRFWFADLLPFQRDPLGFLLARGCSATEPLVRLALGPRRVWLVTDANVVKPILKASEDHIDKGYFIHKLRLIFGHSSLTMSGDEHRRRREALHATFSRGTAQQFVPQMCAIIREMASTLVRDGAFVAHEITAPLTLRLICMAMFGKDVLSSGDENAIVHAVKLVEDDLANELFRVLPRTPWGAKAWQRRRAEARSMLEFVVRRVRDRATGDSAVGALTKLGLNDEEIRDEIITMLLAGHHTTGSAAAWVLYYLATCPELADEIAEEAAAITAEDGELRSEALPRAERSQALVREVLRLFPSAHWFSRDAKVDQTIAGIKLRRGDSIIISPWQLHRDPRWWPQPNEFYLDRSYGGRAYLPFGVGPRACLGMGLAMLELQLLALEFSAAFCLAIRGEIPKPIPTPSVTLIPPKITIELRVRGATVNGHHGGLSDSEICARKIRASA